MPSEYVLAIDAGTSGVRCLVADLEGRPVSLCRQEWSYHSPEMLGPLAKEFDPDTFWETICQTIRGAVRKAGISARAIAGVSATSQREGAVFLDKAGKEIYAGPNIDLRALTEGISLDSEYGAEIYAITGHLPSFMFVPAKLKWFAAHQPQTYQNIATVLTLSDWVAYRLCGERTSEVCSASELGLVDNHERQWSEKLRRLLGLPEGIYPALVPAGSRVGKITPHAAAQTGLSQGTPVVQGAPDTHCGLLSLGIKEQGQVGIILGWSAPVQMATEQVILDPEGRIWTGCHLFPQRWLLESNAGEAGNAYRWLKEIIFGQEESAPERGYELMDRLASAVPPGAEEALAFIGPAAMDMRQLTMRFGGLLFPIPISVTNIQRGHLIRAALENICYAIKANLLQLEAISGLKIKDIALGGGLIQSQCLLQILPAVLNTPVLLSSVAEISALGAAICAAAGSGLYSSLEEAMTAMKPEMKVIEPERLAALEYAEYYQRWLAASRMLAKLSEGTQ
ncbi:MAG TPA: hypothetical protein G4O01_05645 [Dehalococcoidia bacterium]|jgi:autoinducer 2 (AI-2) kinase|nr:hypothetical protein [Dehalococcoidia bacterium]